MITGEEIKKILSKYSIGKKPLSIILGIGEVNIIRYLNGVNPSSEISDLLINILNNPYLYELFLEANKDNISRVAYRKSLSSTKKLELSLDKSKLYNSALYIIKVLGEVDISSLQRILFFADGFSLNFLGSKLFDDSFDALIDGPINRDINDCFSCYMKYNELINNIEIFLSDEEKNYLNTIIKCFGCYSSSVLGKMSCLTDIFINTRYGLGDDVYTYRVIDSEDMLNYFNKIYTDYNMKDLDDISKYSSNLFDEAMKVKFS